MNGILHITEGRSQGSLSFADTVRPTEHEGVDKQRLIEAVCRTKKVSSACFFPTDENVHQTVFVGKCMSERRLENPLAASALRAVYPNLEVIIDAFQNDPTTRALVVVIGEKRIEMVKDPVYQESGVL